MKTATSVFKSKSLLFLSFNAIRFVGMVFLLLLAVSELVSLAQNLRDFQHRSRLPSAQIRSESLSTIAVLVPTTSSSLRPRSLKVAPSPTASPLPFATAIQQPTNAQLASISSAAAARASLLGLKKTLAKRQSLSAGDPTKVQEAKCNFVAGTIIPKAAGAVGFFVLSKIFNTFLLFFMLISELAPLSVARFYTRYFPILGSNAGVGWLGALQVWISSSILSQSQSKFSQVAAWMNFVHGCINIILGLLLQNSIKTARALAPVDEDIASFEIPSRSNFSFARQSSSDKGGSSVSSQPSIRKLNISAPMSAHLPPMYERSHIRFANSS